MAAKSIWDDAWGDPVNGVRVRLVNLFSLWKVGEAPSFHVRIDNQGTTAQVVAQTEVLCRLELDGRIYTWHGERDVKSYSLKPKFLRRIRGFQR